MPSDEMVEKACAAFNDVLAYVKLPGDSIRDATLRVGMREALRAALAAAEAGEQPVAWRYELAGAVTHNPDGSKTGVNWKTHINASPPCVSDWGVRNLTPLFASPPSEASRDERAAIRDKADAEQVIDAIWFYLGQENHFDENRARLERIAAALHERWAT